MLPVGLIDTGAILAIVEVDDAYHADCLESLLSVKMPLLTTEAVITEVLHLVHRRNIVGAWSFLRSGAVTIHPMNDLDLPALHGLMSQYKDRPMDFADATLVHLAARESISLILTVDHDDFETYRIGGRKRFTILPQRTAK